MLDVMKIRKDFPFFANHTVAYLDNSATSQRPNLVLEAERKFYETMNANPMRGLYQVSIEATDAYEQAREKVASFLHARKSLEIIFTRNASESLNLAAYCLGESLLEEGDEILTTVMEHHSNMLPWRQIAQRKGAKVVYLNCDETGEITREEFCKKLSDRTKIVAMTQVSNVFGRENPLETFIPLAHEKGAVFVVDGAQSVPHQKVDVQELDADFLAFSGHKMLAPMGIGVLYGKEEWLEKLPPFLTGGEMIETVSLEDVTYAELPHRFEAGTVNAGGAVALGAAVDYYEQIGMDNIVQRELALSRYMDEKLRKVPYVKVLGDEDPDHHHGIFTFLLEGVHPHDVAAIMDMANVAVRAGHHCAEPLHRVLGVGSTTRASLQFYNTEEEIDRFIAALSEIRRQMGYGE